MADNLITKLFPKYHPTYGLVVCYYGVGEWFDAVKVSKEPSKTDVTRGGITPWRKHILRLNEEDSITLEKMGKVTVDTLYPIDFNLEARGTYMFVLPQPKLFTKDDIVPDIAPSEHKKLCDKYYDGQVLTPTINKPPQNQELKEVRSWMPELKPQAEVVPDAGAGIDTAKEPASAKAIQAEVGVNFSVVSNDNITTIDGSTFISRNCIKLIFDKLNNEQWRGHFSREKTNGLLAIRQGEPRKPEYQLDKISKWLKDKALYSEADIKLAITKYNEPSINNTQANKRDLRKPNFGNDLMALTRKI